MIFKGGRTTLVWVALSAILIGQIAVVIAGALGWLGSAAPRELGSWSEAPARPSILGGQGVTA